MGRFLHGRGKGDGEGRGLAAQRVRGCVQRKAEAVAADVPEATAGNYLQAEGRTGGVREEREDCCQSGWGVGLPV